MRRILFLLFLVTACPALFAQDYETPEVVISVEKANIAGKVYYVHKVLPKQTVYSICKAYGVTENELLTANPDLKDGLKAESILLIPMSEAARQQEALKAAQNRKTEDRETVGTESETEPEQRPEGPEQVIEHRVRWYESLSTVARKYGIPAAKILEYNGLEASQVVRGTVLLIPVVGEGSDPFADDTLDVVPDTVVEGPGEAVPEDPEEPMAPVRKVRRFTADEPMDIALILPFNATGGKASSSFLNFYSGALMAVQEQKEKGAHVVLNVFDLSRGAGEILEGPKFENSDLIIGPVEAATLDPFLAFSDRNGVPMVSPLDHKADSLVSTHPFLFQVPVSTEIQVHNLVANLNPRDNDRIVLVAGYSAHDKELVDCIETIFRAGGISYRKTGNDNLSSQLPAGSRLSPTKVLIGSESKAFATEAIRTLNALSKKNIPMEVWCTNRIRGFEMSDPDALFNIRAHTSAPYFVDYSDPRDRQFVRGYRALFSGEPDDFAFQGYDVFTYFISTMMKLGSAFTEQADLHPMQLLHCNFQFYRDDNESGWRNHATRNLVYEKEDYSITLTK